LVLLINASSLKPWDRDILARANMQLEPDALENEADEPIYFSKEAASGGYGCNWNTSIFINRNLLAVSFQINAEEDGGFGLDIE